MISRFEEDSVACWLLHPLLFYLGCEVCEEVSVDSRADKKVPGDTTVIIECQMTTLGWWRHSS